MTRRAPGAAPERTELTAVVETEARLELLLAQARATAAELRAAAQARATAADDSGRATARAQIEAAIAAEAAAQIAAITATGARTAARYDAIDGAALVALGRWVAEQVVALALEDAP